MIGKAVWDWICSATKRPFIQHSYDELVALVDAADTTDTKTIEKVQEELNYRKRLKSTKKEELRELIKLKIRQIKGNVQQAKGCDNDSALAENENYKQAADRPRESEANKKEDNKAHERVGGEQQWVSGDAIKHKTEGAVIREEMKETDLASAETPASKAAHTVEGTADSSQRDQNRDISQLDISRKTFNALLRNGLENISELNRMSDDEILMLKGIGRKALDEIKEAIANTVKAESCKSEKLGDIAITDESQKGEQLGHKGYVANGTEGEGRNTIYKEGPTSDTQDADLRGLTMIEAFSTFKEEIECLSEAIDAEKRSLCMVSAINNEREFSFILKRMSGMTLEAIGVEAGVTRERVRQVVKKTTQKIGVDINQLNTMLETRRKNICEARLIEMLEEDLRDQQVISGKTRAEWSRIYGREMSLRDRISVLRANFVPIPANELLDHVTNIESGKGYYGGTEYWDDTVTLRLLLNMIALKRGKPGIMPRQIEIPRLVSRYIQRMGGQKQVAKMLGMIYEGPIGSRNRNYWTESRISHAIRDTQKYFGLPEDTMPEQAQISAWLDFDGNDDTKGPSCIAAIKKEGGWKQYSDRKGYRQYIDQDEEGKKEIDSEILLNLWNRNIFIRKESEFMDVFTEFLVEFWNSQGDPRRYKSLANNASRVARSIPENLEGIDAERRKEIVLDAVYASSRSEVVDESDNETDSADVDRFVDLLF